MAVQTIKIGKSEFVLIPKREFARLAAEDEYWTQAALKAEAQFIASAEKAIPMEILHAMLDARDKKPKRRRRR